MISLLFVHEREGNGAQSGADLNLGCPQEHALQGHYGAYLLGQKDWPCIEQIGSSSSSLLPHALGC
jgi:tRNA-dihydrouridine synthase 1